jgi:hypothetical protein
VKFNIDNLEEFDSNQSIYIFDLYWIVTLGKLSSEKQ